jgi:hypothetical protein
MRITAALQLNKVLRTRDLNLRGQSDQMPSEPPPPVVLDLRERLGIMPSRCIGDFGDSPEMSHPGRHCPRMTGMPGLTIRSK